MKRYRIPKHVIAEAEEHDRNMLSTRIGQQPDHTGLDEPHKHKHGYIGEWGFEQVLLELRIPFYKVPNVWAAHDFNIRGRLYDVKAGSLASYERLMVPKKQFSLAKDFYVGCRIVYYEHIEIHGVITSVELGTVEPRTFGKKGVLTYYRGLSRLQPIEEHFKSENFI